MSHAVFKYAGNKNTCQWICSPLTIAVQLTAHSFSDWKLIIDWMEDNMPQQLFEEMSQRASGEKPGTNTHEYIEDYEVDNIIDAVFDDNDVVDED